MEVLSGLFLLLAFACWIGYLVCFIMVVVKMFQNDQSTLGIVCLILGFCTILGSLIAFVLGWGNVKTWKIQKVMMIWTGCLIGGIVLQIIVTVLAFAAADGPIQMQMQNLR